MAKIKICGLSRPEDIDMVNEVLPDYIGFVFAPSRRQISEETAKKLKAMLHPKIMAVGVFVNEDMNQIIRLCNTGVIDIVQLHGDEEEEYILNLMASITNPIIKAVRVRTTEDFIRARELICDFIILDTYKEDQYGGSGETFDWSMITNLGTPFFLAGGIHADNVGRAINQAHPYCIDISSGVETNGWKDPEKIIDIVKKVRSVR